MRPRAHYVVRMRTLSREDRLRLLKFVCSFAWTDLRVTDEERRLVEEFANFYEFDGSELDQVTQWLAVPPPPEEVDPTDIPKAHRQLFYQAAKRMVEADGRVVPGESDALETFRELLHG